MDLLDNFLKYVKIDTQSDENSNSSPSTFKQYDLLNLLKSQLDDLKIDNEIDEFGRLYAWIPGNIDYCPIGVCSHVDTALECSGKDVKPQVIYSYNGDDIPLGNTKLFLSRKEFPKLNECIGKTIITTDGTTLLGSDDKAGCAIIIEIAKEILKLPIDKRRPMSILFTPDEEIGRGPEHFNKEKFGCKYAYTFDGEDPKYVSIENFNARSMKIDVFGKSIHPGYSKGIMINASMVLNELISLLPENEVPSKTENYEGFHHLCDIEGGVEKAHADFILRNFDINILERQTKDFYDIAEKLTKKYPGVKIELNWTNSYANMRPIIDKNPEVTDILKTAFNKSNTELIFVPIRGGTDGATFSFLGVPCPNIGVGGYNCHGKYEFAVLEEMQKMVEIGINIFKI